MGQRKRRQCAEQPRELSWKQLELLCTSEEQRRYELLRPLALFGSSVSERAAETGVSERTLYRRLAAFGDENMLSLFDSPKAKRRVLPPNIRRAIIDLKAEHPPLNLEKIANICGKLFGRRPDGHTVKAVLEENAIPARPVKRFAPYHEIEGDKEKREAVVTLHEEGWADKSIADCLKIHRSTVYRVRKRAAEIEEGEGLRDKSSGRPRGVQKVDLRAMNEVRKLMENPELGEFRVHAALEQKGIYLSPHTVGRVLRANREAEGLAFFAVRFTRKLDALGYARIKHWRVYGEEGLARCEVALWLGNEGLTVEYGARPSPATTSRSLRVRRNWRM